MGGRGAFSATSAQARGLERRIAEIDGQIAAIDERAGQAPRRFKLNEEGVRWADTVELSNRGELVSERKRLQRRLDEMSGGGQMRWRI